MKNKTLTKELKLVEYMIKQDINKEKIISNLYKYIFKSNGKKMRAMLSLIASSKKQNNNRIKLAAVIELLHTATLVHDDVVDDSPTRRGIKSVNKTWSNSHGVLIGDYIYSKAFIYMVDIGNNEILQELANATNDISQGELIQLDAVRNLDITLNRLKKISYFKTGRLFEASAKTGAMLAEKSKEEIKSFGLLGKALGTAFQIQDDVLDYAALKLDTGKPALKDFKEGKITFPLYFALQDIDSKDKKFLLAKLGKQKITSKDQNKIYQLIHNDKSQKQINVLLDKYSKETLKHLNKLKHHACYNEILNLIGYSKVRKK